MSHARSTKPEPATITNPDTISNDKIKIYASLSEEKPTPQLLSCLAKGEELQQHIEKLRTANTRDWHDKAMRLIFQSRYENSKEEVARLVGAGILDAAITERLAHYTDYYLKSYLITCVGGVQDRYILLRVVGQAEEIKTLFKDSHYAFFHGQSQSLYPLSVCFNKQAQRAGLRQDHFQHLRPFNFASKHRTLHDFLKTGSIDDQEAATAEVLLSCTANLVECQPYSVYAIESAMDVILENSNIATRGDSTKTLSRFAGAPESAAEAVLQKIFKSYVTIPYLGNLFVVLIPKNKLQELTYKAHPCGAVCDCASYKKDPEAHLQQWQANQKLEGCRSSQYRLFLPAITSEAGCRIYLCTPLDMDMKYKQDLEETVHRHLNAETTPVSITAFSMIKSSPKIQKSDANQECKEKPHPCKMI